MITSIPSQKLLNILRTMLLLEGDCLAIVGNRPMETSLGETSFDN